MQKLLNCCSDGPLGLIIDDNADGKIEGTDSVA